jgi:transcriptional regulator with XRE-family HTH domain
MSQRELAKPLGTTQPVVSNYESGRRTPQLEVLFGLVGALDVSVRDLLDGVGPDFTGLCDYGKFMDNADKLYPLDELCRGFAGLIKTDASRAAILPVFIGCARNHFKPEFTVQPHNFVVWLADTYILIDKPWVVPVIEWFRARQTGK